MIPAQGTKIPHATEQLSPRTATTQPMCHNKDLMQPKVKLACFFFFFKDTKQKRGQQEILGPRPAVKPLGLRVKDESSLPQGVGMLLRGGGTELGLESWKHGISIANKGRRQPLGLLPFCCQIVTEHQGSARYPNQGKPISMFSCPLSSNSLGRQLVALVRRGW